MIWGFDPSPSLLTTSNYLHAYSILTPVLRSRDQKSFHPDVFSLYNYLKDNMIIIRTLIGTIIIDGVLAMVLFWILPEADVQMSLAFKIAILALFPLWSLLTYIPRKRALSKEVIEPAQAMIGKRGTAINRLDPQGTVRINYEIWNARSITDPIEEGEKIVVLSMDGLTLTVQKEKALESDQSSAH